MEKVLLRKYTDLTVKIETEDMDYLEDMIEEFTQYVDGFQFMPKYKSGRWNGKIGVIDKFTHSFPYGILFDVIRRPKE